jgi:hypothetical protein
MYKKNEGKGPIMMGTVCSLSETTSTMLTEHGRTVIGGIDGDGRVGGTDRDRAISRTMLTTSRNNTEHNLEICVIY